MSAWSGPMPAESTIQNIANEAKNAVENKIQPIMIKYLATLYRMETQPIMTGKMFLIKVDIGIPSNFLHLEVFVPNDHPSSECILLAVQENHNSEDGMEPLV